MDRHFHRFVTLFCFALLPGTLLPGPTWASDATHASSDATTPAVPVGQFTLPALTDLIQGEMALYRGKMDIASRHYSIQARATRDLGIIKRALGIAQLANQFDTVADMAHLWLEQEPDSLEAHYILAAVLLQSGLYDDAMTQLDALLARHPDLDVEQLLAGILNRRTISPEAFVQLRSALELLQTRHPDKINIAYTLALLEYQSGSTGRDHAMTLTDQVLTRAPDHLPAQLLRIRLLLDTDKLAEASTMIDQAIAKHPEQRSLRPVQARILVRLQRYPQAIKVFEQLITEQQDDISSRMALGLLYADSHREADAKRLFEGLLDSTSEQEARIYLAQLAVRAEQLDAAIEQYSHITPGPQFVNAQIQIALLLKQQKRLIEARQHLQQIRSDYPETRTNLYIAEAELVSEQGQNDDALKLMNEAVAQFPGEIKLLLARSVIADRMSLLDLVESDLRRVMAAEADSPIALNALGYTFANHNVRLPEAEALIQKALAIKPDDPAYIDSLGWLRFRQGRLNEANQLIEKAYGLMPDAEIGAHLVEIRWTQGHRWRARWLLRKLRKSHADSSFLTEMSQRLGL